MNVRKINQVFQQIVKAAADGCIEAIRANQKVQGQTVPRPKSDVYATTQLMFYRPQGRAEKTYKNKPDIDLEETICQRFIGKVDINYFKTDSSTQQLVFELATKMLVFTSTSQAQESFNLAGIALRQRSPVLDTTALEKGAFEDRATVSFEFVTTEEVTCTVREIQQLSVRGGFYAEQFDPIDVQIDVSAS